MERLSRTNTIRPPRGCENYVHLTYLQTRVLSIDVGIKHLSFCLIDFHNTLDTHTIEKWELISLNGKNIAEYTRDIVEKMRQYEFGLIDSVLIEQQVSRNTQMKVLSHVLQTYFLCEQRITNDKVIFMSAKRRFLTSNPTYNASVQNIKQHFGISDKMNRNEIKKLSVHITRIKLEGRWLEYFQNHKKRDDLADSFLQALVWDIDRKEASYIDIDMNDI